MVENTAREKIPGGDSPRFSVVARTMTPLPHRDFRCVFLIRNNAAVTTAKDDRVFVGV